MHSVLLQNCEGSYSVRFYENVALVFGILQKLLNVEYQS